ncbi:7251_t:CDS:10 [Funneliformis geosporum]|uniref:7251_t:CDS:1 n=1 Tax=Funneliformis geosporum TaxID=1117311 RepID=A0A9W4SIA1_9GLOM|nr:7251_t:CDS:10 [Funneliformis geosporum]
MNSDGSKIMEDDSSDYIAISPDGSYSATFNSESYELKIYDVKKFNNDDNNITPPIHTIDLRKEINTSANYYYSLAISDYDQLYVYVAVSRFCENTGLIDNADTEKGFGTIDNRGGVVRFLSNCKSKKPDILNEFTKLISMNSSGLEEYEFPTITQVKIDNLYQIYPCTRFLYNIVEKNYLFVQDYKNQRLELYNLQSLDLELICRQRDDISSFSHARENPIFSISKNGHLLAYCNGSKSITIHLMENGLEITTKEFLYAYKILLISFIDDDERLFVVAEDDKFTLKIYIWDIFTSKEIFKIDVEDGITDIFSSLQKYDNHSIACSSGKILALQGGEICSVLELSVFEHKLRPSEEPQELRSIVINQAEKSSFESDQIHKLDGTGLPGLPKEEPRSSVLNVSEPWIHEKQRIRISFLDENVQLIIGKTTVQVWSNDKDLDYIWVNLSNKNIIVESLKIGKHEFNLDLSWDVSNNERNETGEDKHNIHWPNKIHVLKDACVAMEYLYKRKDEPVGIERLTKYKDLVAGTERLIKKCIKEHPGLWSLSEVRYDIMANIIRSKNISLLDQILFDLKVTDGKKTRVSRYLHIPREKKWFMEDEESDLKLAIKESSGGHRRDKVIVAMLLEYYSNNAEKDTGWMFTLTKALPLLQSDFESYLKELFYKPCFGSKEENVDSRFVDQNKLYKGYKSQICSLNVRPRLLLVPKKCSLWNKFMTNPLKWIPNILKYIQKPNVIIQTERKQVKTTTLRVVPLPDFTVYQNETDKTDKTPNHLIIIKFIRLMIWPRGYVNKKKYYSPFLQLINKKEGGLLYELYDNPAMEACINFKWQAAQYHFLRQFFLFIAFSLSFAIISGIIRNPHVYPSDQYIAYIIFFYLGYYLLAEEIVQCKHETLQRYFSIYNLLDVVSILLAIATMIFFLAGNNDNIDGQRNLVITQAFAVLLLWLELLCLTRYFEGTAIYISMILNILKAIWPFLIFMLMTTVAFGHAMHIVLNNPKIIDVKPKGDINVDDHAENYYSSFVYSIYGAYFWALGRWDQLENWDFWPVYAISIAASVLLVIIMQNLLITFMSGVYEIAKQNGKLAVLGYRADLIANYETVDKPTGSYRGNPRYIYYVGSSEYQEEWLDKAENYRKTHTSLLFDDVISQGLSDDNYVTNESQDVKQDEIKSLQDVVGKLHSLEDKIEKLTRLLILKET